MKDPRRRKAHPPPALLLLGLLSGCIPSYRDLGELLLVAGVPLALIGGAMIATLQRIWAPLLSARPSLRRALGSAVAVGAVATILGVAVATPDAATHASGPEGASALRVTIEWVNRLRGGTQFFGTAVLAWMLLAWRLTVRRRPERAPTVLPAALALSMSLALLALLGGRRPLHDAVFYVIYWSGTLGFVPAALWTALALEGALRRSALPNKVD